MIRSPAGFDGGDRIKRYLDYYQPSYGVMMLSAGQFSPAQLFANGEQGGWYDPSDLTTLYQDAAGTTPVTAVEQPVGLMLDKSGRGNHASQSTSASRPVLKQDANGKYYLLFDGTDDSMATSTITPGSVNKVQVFAGVRKLSDAAQGVLAEFSVSSSGNAGSFCIFAPQASADYGWRSRGSLNTPPAQTASSYAAPITNVLTGIGDISGDLSTLRINGSQVAQITTDQGTGNYLSYPLYIGRRGGSTLPFNGNIYSLIVRFSATNLPDATIAQTETWVNGKTGAY